MGHSFVNVRACEDSAFTETLLPMRPSTKLVVPTPAPLEGTFKSLAVRNVAVFVCSQLAIFVCRFDEIESKLTKRENYRIARCGRYGDVYCSSYLVECDASGRVVKKERCEAFKYCQECFDECSCI